MSHNSSRPTALFIALIFALPALMSVQALSSPSPAPAPLRDVAQVDMDEDIYNEIQHGKIEAGEIFRYEQRELILRGQRAKLLELRHRFYELQTKIKSTQLAEIDRSFEKLQSLYLASIEEDDVFSMDEHDLSFQTEATRLDKLMRPRDERTVSR